MDIHIREITADEHDAYRQFLNAGLVNDEEHFRITVEDDSKAPFPTGKPDSFTLGAFAGDVLAGVVSFARDGANREKLRHKGIMFRMYVAASYRGLGIAGLLIAELMKRARAINDIEQINLTVIAGNKKAKDLYIRHGFETYGTEKNAIKWKGKYFDEDNMAARLY